MRCWRLSSGTLEALKWIGLALMLGDHVNAALLDRDLPLLSEAGRIAFPLFACVFGCNLARAREDWRDAYARTLRRLLAFGVISQPFSILAFQRWDGLPLNILFTLAIGLGLVWCIRLNNIRGAVLGSVLFLGGGVLVEFHWPGLLLVVAGWFAFARPGIASTALAITATAGLYFINANLYALLAWPIILLIAWWQPSLPRNRWLFYAFYPAHLAVLALLRYLVPA